MKTNRNVQGKIWYCTTQFAGDIPLILYAGILYTVGLNVNTVQCNVTVLSRDSINNIYTFVTKFIATKYLDNSNNIYINVG